MAKGYMSRAKRLDLWCTQQLAELDRLRSSLENEALEDDAALVDGEIDLSCEFDLSELESLKEEIESWRDNMEGTNLENTEKYQMISECVDTLDSIHSDMESILQSVGTVEELSTALDEIDSALQECDGVEFPTMF